MSLQETNIILGQIDIPKFVINANKVQQAIQSQLRQIIIGQHERMNIGLHQEVQKLIELLVVQGGFYEFYDFYIAVVPVDVA